MRKPTLKTPTRYPDDLTIAVAILTTMGCSTREIACMLRRIAPAVKMSHNIVCRMRKQAVDDAFLQLHPTLDLTRKSHEAYLAGLALLLPLELDGQLGCAPPKDLAFQVHVIPRDATRDDALREFGLMAARLLILPLLDAKLLGVAWGRVVNALVDGLARLPHAPSRADTANPPNPPTRVFPVCGEPLHVATTLHEFSSTVIAKYVGETLDRHKNAQGEKTKVPSLAGVPAYVPGNIGRNGRGVVRKFFARVPSYAGFCGKDGFFSALDTIVSGVGVVGPRSNCRQGVFVSERVIAEGSSYEEMRKLVYGDLAGVLIPRPGLAAVDLAKVTRLNEGWTGLRLVDIQRCAKAAKGRRSGGVIVIANDPSKVELVREIVRQGLVNHLVIDASLAAALRDSAHACPAPARETVRVATALGAGGRPLASEAVGDHVAQPRLPAAGNGAPRGKAARGQRGASRSVAGHRGVESESPLPR